MKVLSVSESRNIKATAAHYHWKCLDFGIGKKRYISKPYYYDVFMRSGQDIDKHNQTYGHQRYSRLFVCHKNCK
ncbi:MAG: hypothetical protein Q4D60_06055 [Eubacteriales bacterium]|nr:hypothetical protein [Eubacteriales bacterium]